MEITNTTPLLEQYKEMQNSIGENTSRVLGSLTNISHNQRRQEAAFERAEERAVLIQQGQSQIVQLTARELQERVQLLKVATLESGELVANNLSIQLTDIGQSCIRASSGFGEAIQAQTQLLSEMLQLYEEAIASNVSKLLEVARAEGEKRSEDMSSAVIVAFENVTTNLREMGDENKEVSDERFNRFQRKIVGILNNVTKSQQQLFSEVGEEMRRTANVSLMLAEGQAELVEELRGKGEAIQVQLTRVEEEVRRHSDQVLSSDYCSSSNITAMLADTEGTCASVASIVSTGNEMLVQELQEQIVRANARLLEAHNRSSATHAQQSAREHNNTVTSITNELVALREMVAQRHTDPSTYTAWLLIFTSIAGPVAKYCDQYVCLCVCLPVREDISGITRAIFTYFLCMLPMSVARSSSGMR